MLTLEAAVDNLDINLRPLVKELFMSTPNLAKDPTLYQIPASKTPSAGKSSTMAPHAQMLPTLSTHLRSTSYNLAAVARKAVVSSPPVLEHKGFYVIYSCLLILSFHVILHPKDLTDIYVFNASIKLK